MNAQDLFKITRENERPLKEVLETLASIAKQGGCQMTFYNYMSTERISELGNLGFKVRKVPGPLGESIYIVSWD